MDFKTEIQNLKNRLDSIQNQNQIGLDIKNDSDFMNHNHDGNNSQVVNLFDILGLYNKAVPPFNLLFKTVSTAPVATDIPSCASDQIQIYVNGTTYRLYWFDPTNKYWLYVTATAKV